MSAFIYDNEETKIAGKFNSSRYAGFQTAVQALMENFTERGLNVMDNLSEIMMRPAMKEEYKNLLTEGYRTSTSSDAFINEMHNLNVEKFDQLFENTRNELLKESSLGQLAPFVGLTMPLLYRHWITCRMKNVIPTEIPAMPTFKYGIEKRFIKDSTGKKYYLPEAFDEMATIMEGIKKPLIATKITAPCSAYDLITESDGQKPQDKISVDFYISDVELTVPDPARASQEAADTVAKKISNLRIRPERSNGMFYFQVNYDFTQAANVAQSIPAIDDHIVETITGAIDWDGGTLTVGSVSGKLSGIYIKGHLSAETNLRSAEVGWDKDVKEFSIPEGTPLNTGITKDRLKDTQALYNIDELAKAINDMGETLNQFRDISILNSLDDSYIRIPTSGKAALEFNCNVPSTYAHDPVAWRQVMLKETLSKIGEKLKQVLKTEDIYFSVAGNPYDVRLLKDVTWVYTKDQEVGGIQLDYSFGLMEGDTHRFIVTSTPRIPQGELRIYLNPTDDKHFVYKHFQYGTIIANDYRNPNNVYVPSVMVSDRYLTEELQPVQGRITIQNNA